MCPTMMIVVLQHVPLLDPPSRLHTGVDACPAHTCCCVDYGSCVCVPTSFATQSNPYFVSRKACSIIVWSYNLPSIREAFRAHALVDYRCRRFYSGAFMIPRPYQPCSIFDTRLLQRCCKARTDPSATCGVWVLSRT